MSEGRKGPPGYGFWVRAERERTARGWTKVALIKRAGIARKTYDRLEVQQRAALPETINKIADALDIDRLEAAQLAGLDPSTVSVSVGETATPQETGSSRLEELLARITGERRKRLERMHAEERDRFERALAQARADYQRSISRIEEILEMEIGRDQKSSDPDDGREGEKRTDA
ncbi:helix-turn-helix domain-containing protein [Streptosporangium sp. NBC_01755]|uniref:helix-turn-helix transcriptional regulator n=1 Tax=Streptosporangium sp. NBC_01755 TaxID=2975949 RepID=UPI002DD8BFC5|nr:helix-turn-helix transcriptional regulator [Streptosporangium sp. NBC_01755]WSC98444.1 helix-turn-helix domain-containing protein [Streptosporangium sp. NBC_01755]